MHSTDTGEEYLCILEAGSLVFGGGGVLSMHEHDPLGKMSGRGYFSRVAILGADAQPLRYISAGAARVMVSSGIASPRVTAGRVRELVLVSPASACAERIGPPSPPSLGGVKFHRWTRLEQSGSRIVEHHPRCLWVV
jgi:hypothetical protein